ncbi:MAG: HTH-type transcriptional activator Btr [Candidatus Ordinivivax streblomastigis]|uniref:HTH-type transcriptional activator Btr n=1 Tax=Candidatus Ordinivivax streblomastigis TaxID=2540710 RepID=A0A5M8P1C0_9BACT|nr:MAG: HTH-type transcriptional activator Btr [Candidatus Ordinivivax streblomastigis]
MNNLVLLNIGYSELNANWNWKEVYSPFARLYYVKSGKAHTYIRENRVELEPGYLYLTPPFTLHDDECDGHFSLYYIHLYEKADNKESIFDRYDFPVKIQASAMDLELIERLHAINPDRYLVNIDPKIYDNEPAFSRYVAFNNTVPYHTQVETRSLLAVLMSRFLEYRVRKAADKDTRINKSLQYIHEHIDHDITIHDLSTIACVSNDHFIRLFKKEMLQTPMKYINAKKIEKAQLLLLTTRSSIRDIAMELSIDNISYFNKIFKQHTGKTPQGYRKEYN